MIYFIENVDLQHIKIGTTTGTAESRLRSMQTGNSSVLMLLGTMDGGAKEEAYLHGLFRHLRIRGEWFKQALELYDFIATYAHLPSPTGVGTDALLHLMRVFPTLDQAAKDKIIGDIAKEALYGSVPSGK